MEKIIDSKAFSKFLIFLHPNSSPERSKCGVGASLVSDYAGLVPWIRRYGLRYREGVAQTPRLQPVARARLS